MTKNRTNFSFQNVGVSKTAIADLKTGTDWRYHQLIITYQDGNASPVDILTALGDIRVKYNTGKVLRIHSATQLNNQINGVNCLPGQSQYKITANGTGVGKTQSITIFFAEPWRKDPTEQDKLAWSADAQNGVTAAQLEVDITSSANTTCALTLTAVHDTTVAPPAGGALVSKVLRQQFAAAGLSIDVPVGTLPPGEFYQAIYILNPSTTGFVMKATLKDGGTTLHDLTQAQNIAYLTNSDMNPNVSTTAGAEGYDLVLDVSDSVLDAYLPGNSLALKLDFATLVSNVITPTAAVGSVTMMVQRLGLLDL